MLKQFPDYLTRIPGGVHCWGHKNTALPPHGEVSSPVFINYVTSQPLLVGVSTNKYTYI